MTSTRPLQPVLGIRLAVVVTDSGRPPRLVICSKFGRRCRTGPGLFPAGARDARVTAMDALGRRLAIATSWRDTGGVRSAIRLIRNVEHPRIEDLARGEGAEQVFSPSLNIGMVFFVRGTPGCRGTATTFVRRSPQSGAVRTAPAPPVSTMTFEARAVWYIRCPAAARSRPMSSCSRIRSTPRRDPRRQRRTPPRPLESPPRARLFPDRLCRSTRWVERHCRGEAEAVARGAPRAIRIGGSCRAAAAKCPRSTIWRLWAAPPAGRELGSPPARPSRSWPARAEAPETCAGIRAPVSASSRATRRTLTEERQMDITNIRSAITSPLRRATALTALATTGLALAIAGPAGAEGKNPTPPAKKGCEVQLKGPGAGQSIVYPDGYSFSVYAQSDNKTHTYTCNDGTWTETVSLTAGVQVGVAAPIGSFEVLDSGAARFDSRFAGASAFAKHLALRP